MSLGPGSGSGSGSETRKKGYKTAIVAEEGRRRREEDLIGIRKNKRRDALLNKRRVTHAVPSYDTILTEGILPLFVELLSRHDAPQLQFEALSVLTNLASGTSEYKRVIVELGVVPTLVNLLSSSSSNNDIREETICALGNIAGDSPSYRDFVLSHGALSPLLSQLEPESLLQLEPHSAWAMLRLATWCLSILVCGYPPVNFEQVKSALPVLRRLIHSTDEEVVADACWALSYLSDVPINNIQDIIEAGVCPKLVELLLYPSDAVIEPALRTLRNIVYGDDAQTQHVIDSQLLPCLHQLLTQEHKKNIIKEACWTISNIAAGNRAQIQAVIDANIIPPLVGFLLRAEFDIKEDVAWAIFNVTSRGSHDNIRYLAAQGCIKALCDLLSYPDPMINSICLEGLENILSVGKADKEMGLHGKGNIFALRVDECEGWDKIENLLTHQNNQISERAAMIVDKFWRENDLEDMNVDKNDGDGSEQDLSFDF
ncbi:Importin subunit alpha-4 [Glycine soja]|uniref:Importin subunit alpha n=1 Tax=Glycine soja TaxID=3848 RepID=A0A445FK96_GLYSO|nr:Importin subunit alpha-4 [Glycine soja]